MYENLEDSSSSAGFVDGRVGSEAQVRRSARYWQLVCKRVIDIAASGVLLIILFPLLVVVGVAIKITSPGPILYRWPVVGIGGTPLRAYKFRTMVVGADKMKEQLLEKNEANGPVFKMRNDPRVTPVGRVLRKLSLDELPQLWSVLKGDMSLVGPRPVSTHEWKEFRGWHRRKLSVQPGIVCLWHLRGQPRDFDKWVALDLEYIDNWSLRLDLKLLTFAVLYAVTGRNY